jgi:hypothetical protein
METPTGAQKGFGALSRGHEDNGQQEEAGKKFFHR